MYKLFLAWRYLTSRKIMYFCIAGIAIGVMALIIVTSVMGGFVREVRERIRGTASHISVTNPSGYFIRDYQKLMDDIKSVPGVAACAPRLEWGALLGGSPQQMRFVQVTGIDSALEIKVSEFARYLLGKTPADFGNVPDGAIVGSQIFGIPPFQQSDAPPLSGTCISLTTARFSPLGIPLPVRKDFTAVGTFNIGMLEYDTNIYIPLAAAQEFLSASNVVTRIAIKLDDYGKAPQVIKALDSRLPSFLLIQTWEQEKRILLRAVAIEKNLNAIILFFIVIVAAFNILSMLTMRVVEKTHDIGIIKSMGATTGGIAQLFLYQGILIALVGCIIGVTCGYAIASNLNPIADLLHTLFGFEVFPKDVYLLDQIPSEISLLTIIVITIATIAVSVIFSIYPSVKASRLQPTEALKYE
ncbi:MAG: ABC transporter permease [Planctomycetota bacterium]